MERTRGGDAIATQANRFGIQTYSEFSFAPANQVAVCGSVHFCRQMCSTGASMANAQLNFTEKGEKMKPGLTVSTGTIVITLLLMALGTHAMCQQAHACTDIKPWSDPNAINLNSRGVIPVAILTWGYVDATEVNPSTVTFGPNDATPVHGGHIEDVDGDGDLDMVLPFKVQDTGIQPGDTQAYIYGTTFGGLTFFGYDAIVTVPPH